MAESLIIKDGNGTIKSLQVDSGSNGYVGNHTLISTVTASNVDAYANGSGWNWGTGIAQIATYNQSRKSIIVNNNSEAGKCYVLMGNSDFSVSDNESPPGKYTFLLDAGGVYFGDSSTSALEHHIYVPSSSYADASVMTVTVTQIY